MAPSYYYISKTLLLTFPLFLLLKNVVSEPNYFFTSCDEGGNYTKNSLYQENLHGLLIDLVEQSSDADFYNTTNGDRPNIVYGTYYCRRDVSSVLCRDCVWAAAPMIVRNCTREKEAVVWYQECTLRYADRPIMGLDEDDFRWARWFSDYNVSNPGQLQVVLTDAMDSLIQKAAYNSSYNGYATGHTPFQPFPTLYTLVQCSPDILGRPCERCLRRIYRDMQQYGPRVWIMIFRTNCQMRYDMAPFYSPLASPSNPQSPDKGVLFYLIRAGIPAIGFVLLVALSIIAVFMYKKKKTQQTPTENNDPVTTTPVPDGNEDIYSDQSNSTESLQYTLDTIKSATNNFSIDNKLGRGGFGVVYKGRLPDGQDVAVKRLSEDTNQGLHQFTNEVKLLAKLQHRNLVKLLGFCMEGEEKLLIYEFVSNLSLDKFLSDPIKRKCLDWETRFKIISGIGRGLLYLHVDSRVKIIHRDLKTGNILLDKEMNPKIADFGLARLMKFDHSQANTTKIFGTYGYMAPEYATIGAFSVKSDVYSFGVMLLEIISGQSNNMFTKSHGQVSLVNHARRLWHNESAVELVDPSLENNFSRTNAIRCIEIGLICTREDPSSRPTMEDVLLLLHNNSDVQILSRPSGASSDSNLRHEHIPEEHFRDYTQESDQPYTRNKTYQFADMHPR